MKKVILIAIMALASVSTFAQKDSGFGIKAGVNYNGNGNYFESIGDAAKEPEKNIGYHAGIFGKIKISRLYVRPELIYTATKSNYEGDSFDMSKLDLPVLVGLKVVGPVHIFAGPAFQYILSSEFEGVSIDNIENDFSVGAHLGIGANLGKLGIDIRYERGLSSNEAQFINTNIQDASVEGRLDTRPDQLILSVSLKL